MATVQAYNHAKGSDISLVQYHHVGRFLDFLWSAEKKRLVALPEDGSLAAPPKPLPQCLDEGKYEDVTDEEPF